MQVKHNQPKYMVDFLRYLKVIKGKSENTIIGYENDLYIFFRFLKLERGLADDSIPFNNINIIDCDEDFIRKIDLSELYAFIEFVQDSRGNINSSKARKIACLRSFFKYLHKKAKIINENIAAELESPKLDKRNPICLTLEESRSLLQAVDKKNKNYYRDYCILTIFLNCGVRLSELVSINIDDIKEDTIRIIGKGNKERTIYLTPACILAIDDYMKIRQDIHGIKGDDDKKALFISNKKNRLNKRTINDIVKKYTTNIGLIGKYTPHKLRHTAATILYKYGEVDIRTLQQILGHESVATTQIYTHIDNEDIRVAVNKNPLGHID